MVAWMKNYIYLMLVLRFSVRNGNGTKEDLNVINNVKIVRKLKRKMRAND